MIKADKKSCMISGTTEEVMVTLTYVIAGVYKTVKDDFGTKDLESFFQLMKYPVGVALEEYE